MAYEQPFTTKSDFARLEANAIAEAASIGWLTTFYHGHFRNVWRVTVEGHEQLRMHGYAD